MSSTSATNLARHLALSFPPHHLRNLGSWTLYLVPFSPTPALPARWRNRRVRSNFTSLQEPVFTLQSSSSEERKKGGGGGSLQTASWSKWLWWIGVIVLQLLVLITLFSKLLLADSSLWATLMHSCAIPQKGETNPQQKCLCFYEVRSSLVEGELCLWFVITVNYRAVHLKAAGNSSSAGVGVCFA